MPKKNLGSLTNRLSSSLNETSLANTNSSLATPNYSAPNLPNSLNYLLPATFPEIAKMATPLTTTHYYSLNATLSCSAPLPESLKNCISLTPNSFDSNFLSNRALINFPRLFSKLAKKHHPEKEKKTFRIFNNTN